MKKMIVIQDFRDFQMHFSGSVVTAENRKASADF